MKKIKVISKKQGVLIIASGVLFVLSFIITQLAKYNIEFVEKYYSLGFYKFYITVLTKINSIFPFSIAEVLVVVSVIFSISYVFLFVKTLFKARQKLVSVILWLVFPISILYFICSIGFTPNYYRYTFANYSGLEMVDTTVDNLYLLCEELALNANEFRAEVNQDGQVFDYTKTLSNQELFEICTNAYDELFVDYPEYEVLFDVVLNARPKSVVLSEIMSYLKITGFFFPFTGEANINTHTSDIYIPSTVCHELAHVAGFMREDEANFISYLVCRSSDNEYLNYSGTMLAFVHSTNALYSKNQDKYFEIIAMLSQDVIMDINAHSEYYNKYDTNIGKISNTVNDTYLKANDQQDGVNSYGRMVDLLIADYNLRQN